MSPGFVGPRQSAVLAHAPEVDGNHEACHRRQHDDVQRVKPGQRLLPDDVAAEQEDISAWDR